MSAARPATRPKESLSDFLARVRAAGIPLPDPSKEVFVGAVRGYYRDTLGQPGQNDVGMYDDAIFISCPPMGKVPRWTSFNANTDPSRYGWNPGAWKYMARLKPGAWWMQPRFHARSRPSGHPAFGQEYNPVTVERIRQDGTVAETETGCFGIDLHKGGDNGTSSEGCQTIPPEQWPGFYAFLGARLMAHKQARFRYILVENK